MKILITGAAGKTGRAIIKQVLQSGWSIRAWVRSADRVIEGVGDYFVGELLDRDAWKQAYEGVDTVYHICPNMHPKEIEIGRFSIEAAEKAGVKRFLYHSVLHPQTEGMPHHWHKLRVEEMLLASGLTYTILQPTAYMQNLAPQIDQMRSTGQLMLPYPATSAISLVDLDDVAEAISTILQEGERWHFATLELVGTKPLSQNEIAHYCQAWLGNEISFSEIPLSEWTSKNRHLNQYARETLLKMFWYYANHGLAGSPAVLTAILGRKPTVFADWLKKVK